MFKEINNYFNNLKNFNIIKLDSLFIKYEDHSIGNYVNINNKIMKLKDYIETKHGNLTHKDFLKYNFGKHKININTYDKSVKIDNKYFLRKLENKILLEQYIKDFKNYYIIDKIHKNDIIDNKIELICKNIGILFSISNEINYIDDFLSKQNINYILSDNKYYSKNNNKILGKIKEIIISLTEISYSDKNEKNIIYNDPNNIDSINRNIGKHLSDIFINNQEKWNLYKKRMKRNNSIKAIIDDKLYSIKGQYINYNYFTSKQINESEIKNKYYVYKFYLDNF